MIKVLVLSTLFSFTLFLEHHLRKSSRLRSRILNLLSVSVVLSVDN